MSSRIPCLTQNPSHESGSTPSRFRRGRAARSMIRTLRCSSPAASFRAVETDDEIGETALRCDVGGYVRFPGRDLRADLRPGVAALGHVPLHLTFVLEFLFWVEPDVEAE